MLVQTANVLFHVLQLQAMQCIMEIAYKNLSEALNQVQRLVKYLLILLVQWNIY